MLHPLEECRIQCPYCGEMFTTLIDCSVSEQSYIEDCEICCRPINFQIVLNEAAELQVITSDENNFSC